MGDGQRMNDDNMIGRIEAFADHITEQYDIVVIIAMGRTDDGRMSGWYRTHRGSWHDVTRAMRLASVQLELKF